MNSAYENMLLFLGRTHIEYNDVPCEEGRCITIYSDNGNNSGGVSYWYFDTTGEYSSHSNYGE